MILLNDGDAARTLIDIAARRVQRGGVGASHHVRHTRPHFSSSGSDVVASLIEVEVVRIRLQTVPVTQTK